MFGVIVEIVCHGTASTALRGPTGPVYPGGADTAQAEFVMCDESIEQDQRGIKRRYHPMCGFKTFATAARFCSVFDEIRGFLRPQSHRNQSLTLAQRRRIHQARFTRVMGILAAA